MLLCISKTVSVIVQQLAPNRESIKLLDPAGRLADTPAEKHIEFQSALAAEPNQRRDIQRFEKKSPWDSARSSKAHTPQHG